MGKNENGKEGTGREGKGEEMENREGGREERNGMIGKCVESLKCKDKMR